MLEVSNLEQKWRAVNERSRVDCVRKIIFKPMFIEANNKDGNRILINTNAIAYVDFDADFGDYVTGMLINGVRIHFQASTGDGEIHYLAFQDFAGKEAENLRAGLAKALGVSRFS
ncbi:MAG: hypothetical protein RM049_26690 [Nostoc sp. DedQUE04]|uniref:hypothetical protein n=1 Tax=Nostoc sp. DedQUE04 TaxID=3075390 RepID=UPI002AD50DBA|nr:hypothetical protein [Nostoc sp. DedQUE04]MDZ8138848.1 hypothetical protein [Nostoc sp. DedQUE04]